MLQLSRKWGPILASQPETGMGYQVTRVTLTDGRRYDDVVVVGGTITEVAGRKEVPFSEDQITTIEVTRGPR
ncbi:MAG: hypothetical protein WD749_07445 [Phycisphaerales bacterium]